MANLDFNEDLRLGNSGELEVIEFLEKRGCKFVSLNHNNKFDVVMLNKGQETTYEIKTDVKCAPLFDTGNIFIEFQSRNNPSGITTSKAKWFVTYFKYLNEIWFIETEKLRNLIANNEFKIFHDAGDIGSATHGYLINRKEFKNYFYVFKTK